jgi:hypothetical protein
LLGRGNAVAFAVLVFPLYASAMLRFIVKNVTTRPGVASAAGDIPPEMLPVGITRIPISAVVCRVV